VIEMKKKTAFILMLAAGVAGVVAIALWVLDLIPLWLYEAVLVIDFPLFVLFLGLWWMAREGEADIPFLGY